MILPEWFKKLQPTLNAIRTLTPRPFAWIQNAIGGGDQRVHALCALIACTAMSAMGIILALAAYKGREVSGEMVAVCGGLGLFAGTVYVTGKINEKKPGDQS